MHVSWGSEKQKGDEGQRVRVSLMSLGPKATCFFQAGCLALTSGPLHRQQPERWLPKQMVKQGMGIGEGY